MESKEDGVWRDFYGRGHFENIKLQRPSPYGFKVRYKDGAESKIFKAYPFGTKLGGTAENPITQYIVLAAKAK